MLSWEEAEREYGPLLLFRDSAKYLNIAPSVLAELISNGVMDGVYLCAGIDVEVIKMHHFQKPHIFPVKNLDAFKDRYLSLKDVAEKLNVSYSLLMNGSRSGYWSPVPGHTRLWDSEEIKVKLSMIHRPLMSYLTDAQHEIIDQYIVHRKKGRPIRYMGIVCQTGFSSDTRAETVREMLSRIFYRISCGRSGFVAYSEPDSNMWYRPLTPTEEEVFRANPFLVVDFSYADLKFVDEGLKPTTQHGYHQELKPFLVWYLKQEQLNPDNDRFNHPGNFERFKAMSERITLAMDEFLTVRPESENPRVDVVFLTRKQVVQIYTGIWKSNLRNPLKNTALFMIGCLLGLRPPSELIKLRIEYFVLDKDGYIAAVNDDGYGFLKLPAHASKGGYSPSHPTLHTLVVPLLRTLLNQYLSWLYQQYSVRGKGYLFRPDATEPEIPHGPRSRRSVEEWVEVARNLDCLNADQRHMIAYDTRHTINELINSSTVTDIELLKQQERVGEIQIRHNINEKTGRRRHGTTARVHYRKDPTAEQYLKIINETLNFPWDLDELEKWEVERGYRTVPQPVLYPPSPYAHPSYSSPVTELTEEQKAAAELLEQYQAEYAKLCKGRPKKMDPLKWSQRLDWLQNQISHLEVAAARKF